MMEKVVEQRPNAAWYVILETDTYVFWKNLFELLSDDRFYPFMSFSILARLCMDRMEGGMHKAGLGF